MDQKRRNKRRRGFALAEVVIASALIAGLIYLVFGVLGSFQKARIRSKHLLPAITISEGILEDSLAASLADPLLAAGVLVTTYDQNGVAGGLPVFYTATKTVTFDVPLAGLRRIDLIVAWIEDRQPRQVDFFTIRD